MKLENAFTVPVPPAEAWRVLLDVERIAPCMPGATLETVDDDAFTGRVKVKVGPINLTYAGEARFSSRDEQARVAVIEGRGKETRGPGTATATVTCRLSEEGDGTRVDVETDLAVTGKPAQFGRGVLADVSSKLVDQFASCLSRKLASGDESAAGAASDASGSSAAPAAAAGAGAAATPGAGAGAGAGRSPRAAVSGSVADGTLAGQEPAATGTAGQPTVEGRPPAHAAPGPEPVTTGVAPASEAAHAATPGGRSTAASAPPSGPRRVVSQPESEPIDLLGTAGAPVLKRAAPALAALVLLAILLGWRRRQD